MKCQEVTNDILNDYNRQSLNRTLTQNVREHLTTCKPCLSRHEEISNITEAIRNSPESNPQAPIPELVDEKIYSDIHRLLVAKQRQPAINQGPNFRLIYFSAAAALLLGILTIFFIKYTSNDSSAIQPGLSQESPVIQNNKTGFQEAKTPVSPALTSTTQSDITPKKQTAIKGDINLDGVSNIIDSMLVCQYILDEKKLVVNDITADVNSDGEVDIGDALAIAQKVVE